jgi:putative oxidoreductase
MNAMTLSSLAPAGRFLLASLYLFSGLAKLAAPGGVAAYMATKGLPESFLLAAAVGLFEVVAGLTLVVGYKTRWTGLLLAAFTLIASLMFHAYWSAPVEEQSIQQLLFFKNIALVGALLFVASTGAGPWSLDARAASIEADSFPATR